MKEYLEIQVKIGKLSSKNSQSIVAKNFLALSRDEQLKIITKACQGTSIALLECIEFELQNQNLEFDEKTGRLSFFK